MVVRVNKVESEHEKIWEFDFDFLFLSLALVEIDDIGPEIHYHKNAVETYVLVSGSLEVYLGDVNSTIILDEAGDAVRIPKGVPHKASAERGSAKFLAISIPGWSEDDHYIYSGDPIMH